MEIDINPKASKWILKQPWLPQFINNCIAEKNSPEKILSYLLGAESLSTINDAFLWVDTPEGREFWSKIDDEMFEVGEKENWDDFDTTIEI